MVVKERFCMVEKNGGAEVDSFIGSYHAEENLMNLDSFALPGVSFLRYYR